MAVWEDKAEVFAHRNRKALGTYITSSQIHYLACVEVSIVVSCFKASHCKILQVTAKLLQVTPKLLQVTAKLPDHCEVTRLV